MTTTGTFAVLTLLASFASASACVVAGEDEASLEEIEATCSSKPGTGEPGELKAVTLYKEGKEVSYDSLSREERALLDETLDFIEGSGHSGSTGCNFRTGGWTCEGEEWVCSCSHLSSGPMCDCHDAC